MAIQSINQQHNQPSFGALKFRNKYSIEQIKEIMQEFIPETKHGEYLKELCRIDAQTTKDGTHFIAIPTYPSGILIGNIVDSQNVIKGESFAVSHDDGYNKTASFISKQIKKARIKTTGQQEPKTRVTSKDILDRMVKGLGGFEVLG